MFWSLPSWPVLYLHTAVIAFVISAVLMPLCIWLLRRNGVLDEVADNKIHEKPVPRGGGIVIFLAFAIAVILPNYRDNPMKGVLIGAAICLVVGMLDDLRGGVRAIVKFTALVGATIVLSSYGVKLTLFGSYPLDLLLTIVWIVGVTSAFNGIDNMDGLASGVAVIVSAMFLTIATASYYHAGTETSLSWFGLLAAGLIGANLGFLLYNVKPARIFMGDSGSFFLGFTLSALGVMGEWNSHPVIAATIPVLILGVPIFDFAYIILTRILTGETRSLISVVEHCAPDHLSHRLVWFGFSQRNAVLVIYLMCFVLGLSGILLRNSQEGLDSVLALLQGGSVIFLIVLLMATAEAYRQRLVRKEVELIQLSSAKPSPIEAVERKSA